MTCNLVLGDLRWSLDRLDTPRMESSSLSTRIRLSRCLGFAVETAFVPGSVAWVDADEKYMGRELAQLKDSKEGKDGREREGRDGSDDLISIHGLKIVSNGDRLDVVPLQYEINTGSISQYSSWTSGSTRYATGSYATKLSSSRPLERTYDERC